MSAAVDGMDYQALCVHLLVDAALDYRETAP
jgi:hypothetical protein